MSKMTIYRQDPVGNERSISLKSIVFNESGLSLQLSASAANIRRMIAATPAGERFVITRAGLLFSTASEAGRHSDHKVSLIELEALCISYEWQIPLNPTDPAEYRVI